MWSSPDRVNWKREKPVFDQPPAWAVEAVPGFKGHIWAPDIFYHQDQYYLFYSVSAFGKNTSCIGLAINKTLDPTSKAYKWEDQGKIVQSVPGRDLWNAIDPNVVLDKDGTPWLSFGSFWTGIKLVKLRPDLKAVAEPQVWRTLASRYRDFKTDEQRAGAAAIEAPFIFKKGNFYYLFVSWDACCQGLKSTYKIVVGRSENVDGPYVDKEGQKMTEGGGSVLLAGDKDWPGLGHNAVATFDKEDYLIFHGYDASDNGKSKLQIRKLTWDAQSWPRVE
jgi:arabinan endo-1,5-alpha-L-arabinosidase